MQEERKNQQNDKNHIKSKTDPAGGGGDITRQDGGGSLQAGHVGDRHWGGETIILLI